MAKEHVHGVFESIAGQYDMANDRISLGMHRRWKQKLVDMTAAACAGSYPGMVLDVCCGTGDVAERIAAWHPEIFVTGLDFSSRMLDVARGRMGNLPNVMLVEGNALALPFDDDTFDAAVISFGLRNTPDYAQVVREMSRVVHGGGLVACLDASVPDEEFIKPFYDFYYKNVMTMLGGGVRKRAEYEWLYQSTQEFLRKDELERLFRDAGLQFVSCRSFMFGAAALHIGFVPRDLKDGAIRIY